MTPDACDCCGKPESVGVCSSALGPISLSYCRECAVRHAEPAWLVVTTYCCTGGDLADWVLDNMTTVVDGDYLPVREFIARNKDELAEELVKFHAGLEAMAEPEVRFCLCEPGSGGLTDPREVQLELPQGRHTKLWAGVCPRCNGIAGFPSENLALALAEAPEETKRTLAELN